MSGKHQVRESIAKPLTAVSRSLTSGCLPMSPRTTDHWLALLQFVASEILKEDTGVQEPHGSELLSASAPLVPQQTIHRVPPRCGAQDCCWRLLQYILCRGKHRPNFLSQRCWDFCGQMLFPEVERRNDIVTAARQPGARAGRFAVWRVAP